ncbi:superoxide dismutase family protein [Piscinibacter koreensis]|uniref:Superoxide dismutase [Cu-Zn] n=1 Tax=Piscinibacter koreensis TaxID=2742824 RepID=A0A7Y6TWA4_9BURK|nr:superoxide dismutase family protein [Schlegelella koreensis]NUZ05885.1 superoxide dismutase family protein [Schlegelella koreensis]
MAASWIRTGVALTAAGTLATLAGCMTAPASSAEATARLQPTAGNSTSGTVRFSQVGSKVQVDARVSGLKPNSEHGFHVHEKGDCSSPDAMSAGGHFNPTAEPHGPQSGPHHRGDMPSLKSDASGNASATFQIDGTLKTGAATDIVGKGVIVHAMPDDYATQPTGNAGGRLACGVISAS